MIASDCRRYLRRLLFCHPVLSYQVIRCNQFELGTGQMSGPVNATNMVVSVRYRRPETVQWLYYARGSLDQSYQGSDVLEAADYVFFEDITSSGLSHFLV
jgi:hypothetical protein